MAVEELSGYVQRPGVIVSAHTSLCASPIYEFGNEEQRKKYLPKLCSGEWIGAFGLTEPNAGTDASAQQTMAVAEEDHLCAQRVQNIYYECSLCTRLHCYGDDR